MSARTTRSRAAPGTKPPAAAKSKTKSTAKAEANAKAKANPDRATKAEPKPKAPRPPKLTPQQAAAAWAKSLEAERPGLSGWVLDRLNEFYGRPVWERRNDPVSELVLTILSQNSADVNAEVAFDELRRAYPSAQLPDGEGDLRPLPGWGGRGIHELPPPDWSAVESAPLDELVNVIRPGGLAPQKAPRVQASLAAVRDQTGGYSLEFLGEMPAREAREWMTRIPGIGPKTASVVLLFSFGTPLMPVDRHVERVAKRVGLIAPKADSLAAHEEFLALLEPDQMYEAHVNLITHGRQICHAQRPECPRCPLAERCRYYNQDAV